MHDDAWDALTPVTLSRLRQATVMLGHSPLQVAVLAIGGIILLTALYTSGGNGLLWTSPGWAAAAAVAYVPVAGKPAIEWAPTLTRWMWRKATGRTVHLRKVDRPTPADVLELPQEPDRLRFLVDPVTGAGMLHDRSTQMLIAVLPVTYPGYALLDPADQQHRAQAWGRVLAGICRSPRIARLQVLERTLPDTGRGLMSWWAHNGVDDGSWVAAVYRDLLAEAGPAGEQHLTTISLALDLHTGHRAIRAAGGGLAGAAAVLRQEMTTLASALHSADLNPGNWHTAGEIAQIVRAAYDPAHSGRGPAIDNSVADTTPMGVLEEWDRLRSDSGTHAVYWVSEWPRTQVTPGFLHPLILTSGIRRSFTLLFDPVPAHVAVRQLRKRKTGHLADAAQRARIGQLDDARATAEYQDALQQEADLIAGHGVARYTGLLSVTATAGQDLEAVCATVEQAALQAGCELRRLVGQQAAAFTAATLPFCRGL